MRTADDFVEDMLSNGRDWIDIMSVASVVRHGAWRNRAEEILMERKLIPASKTERAELMSLRLKDDKETMERAVLAAAAEKKANRRNPH